MKNSFLIFLLLSALTVFAQNDTLLEKQLFKFNVLTPSFESESKVTAKTTIDFKVGVGFSINGGSGRKTDWSFFPFGEIQYRYYYNLEKRKLKGKNTTHNSGNYLALNTTFQSRNPIFKEEQYIDNLVTTIGPVWGIQRNTGRNFNYGIQLGIGYQIYDRSNNEISPILGIDLGWVL